MAYTTPAKVQAILDRKCNIDLSPFIAAANSLVVNVCVPLSYDDATLEKIETWLSAHFYHILAMRNSEGEADGIKDVFQSKVDLGLKVTHYGQMAMILDYKGGLARLDFSAMGKGKPRLSLTWLGKPPRRTPPWGWPPAWNF